MKTLDEVLIKAIEKTEGAIDGAVDFTMEQAPEVIHQAMMWYMVQSIIVNLISLVTILLIFCSALLLVIKAPNRPTNDKPSGNWLYERYYSGSSLINGHIIPIGMIYGFAIVFLFFGSVFSLNLTWLKIWIAPKFWLIEYAASLVK